jgi:hypothetical protein
MALIPHANPFLHSPVHIPEAIQADAGVGGVPTASDLSLAITAALRRALAGKFFATLDAEKQLRLDLQAVCQAARHQNMRVEYLIIAFKDAWRSLPEARTLPQGTQGPDLLNRIITLCIAEFYGASRGD